MKFSNLVELLKQTHQELKGHAARSVDKALIIRNWLFGWYIVEYEQNGEDRAEYGRLILPKLSEKMH